MILADIELNCFAFLILLLIFGNIQKRRETFLIGQRLFLALLFSNALMLALDTALWVLNGRLSGGARIGVTAVALLYYALIPLPCILWCLYADFQGYRSKRRVNRMVLPLTVPAIANLLLAVISIFSGFYFRIDAQNVYHRGNLFFIPVSLCALYVLVSQVSLLHRQDRIDRVYYLPMFISLVPPVVGGLLQAFLPGVSLLWAGMSVSVLILFLNIQNDQLYRDHLTGLYNRRQLDCTLREMIGHDGPIAGIMIDIDRFKEINDRYGHAMGDRALVDAGRILSVSFAKKDLVCRYGGDEFVVILEPRSEAELLRAVERIRRNLRNFSLHSDSPYSLSFSIGYDMYGRASGISAKQFLKHIDTLMYQDKKRRKIE